MAAIEVDFEVFKELTVRRKSESMTENDVIRSLLGLDDPASKPTAGDETTGGNPWVCKGVTFPHGTEFRATYKGRMAFTPLRYVKATAALSVRFHYGRF